MLRLLICLCGLLGSAATVARSDEPLREAIADTQWDAVFDRTEGWVGGDAIYSTPLPGDDVLWLFADTFVGAVREGRRQPGVRMVNNTLARHALLPAGGAPDPRSVRFHWGGAPDIAEAKAWIAPDPALEPDGKPTDQWYWVADAIVAPGAAGRDRLVVFLWRIARTSNEVFGFRGVGNALATIDDPAVDWKTWRPHQTRITHASPTTSNAERRSPEISWGSELAILPEKEGSASLLIYGYRSAGQGMNDLVIAHAPAESIENMDRWQFRTTGGWSPKVAEAAPLASGLTTEFSVTRLDTKPEVQWVLIHSEPWFGTRIMARTARSPFGPWSAMQPVYQIPGVDPQKKHFAYAAKAHPEVSRPGELLVSYVVNSFDFSQAVNDAGIYRPRFVRVPTSALPTPPAGAR